MSKHRSFFNRRLHSLLGVIPVGFFLVEHLITNYEATKGVNAFVEQVEWIWGIPFLPVLEIFFIFLPLLYHGVYGLYIAFTGSNNLKNFSTFRNVMFMLQRVTGVITLIFVTMHVWETRLKVALYDYSAHELAGMTAQLLSDPVTQVWYAIGILAAVFHFSNGMWSFLVSWGITVGPRAQRVSSYVWAVVFVLVSYVGLRALFAFGDLANQLAQR
ncbi:MAG: succinate dehydrogenase cytochrome b558 subunit [Firmicutes bacterium]|uniref:Succinate dehydrogenase subunit C n=1 Tax=Melghirimyces thermohalophilus TaxID=1236220 RepID=A0A1G6JT55_9BACL|nr:succinate dehydrogenase cytochrome b558 subunit [Melghirimyces thermohalophilus]MDA8353187.1 succinate dehydrogenase cytochrome b558 subunit [Bacillota bacterium]SDC21883.1 succinate dehydrogenase subunit C [Melghirimyces thermohalophilus]